MYCHNFWCNWRSLEPFLLELYSPIKTTTMDKLRSGNENYELFCSLKVNGLATRTKHENDRLSIVDR